MPFFPLGVFAMFNHSKYREQRHLADNSFGVLSALCTKRKQKTMKYLLYRNLSKYNQLKYLNDLFEIKLIFLRS